MIKATGLTKRYARNTAVSDISLRAAEIAVARYLGETAVMLHGLLHDVVRIRQPEIRRVLEGEGQCRLDVGTKGHKIRSVLEAVEVRESVSTDLLPCDARDALDQVRGKVVERIEFAGGCTGGGVRRAVLRSLACPSCPGRPR